MINKNITTIDEIDSVITELALGISNIFDREVIGIYLFGSLTYGDFNLDSSDVDLVTITKNPASQAQINQLKKLHSEMETEYPKWAKRTESSYTPQNMLTSVNPPGSRPYYSEGIFYPQADYGNEWIINLYLLFNYGRTVYGTDFKTLVQPIKIEDVQQACIRDLHKEWEPKLSEPEWLNNPHYQSYLVMNLCRIFNTVINATTLSKKQSAAWVKRQYPQWTDLIRTAENWQYGLEMYKNKETLKFLKFVIEKVSNFAT